MKRLPIRAIFFLVATAYSYQAISLAALSHYSIQDDQAAVKAYAAKPNHNARAAALYQQAVDLLAKGQDSQAKTLLDQTIKLDPVCADAYSSLAYCQTWLERYQDGAKLLTQAISLDSNKPIYFFRKALCYFTTQQLKDAITQLNFLLAIKPDDGDGLRLRARCYRVLSQDSEAIADFSQLIKLNTYTSEALSERANIYAQSGNDDKALQDFQEALKIQPNNGEAYAGRAAIFYKQHKYRLAADNYSAANVYGNNKIVFCKIQLDASLRHLNK